VTLFQPRREVRSGVLLSPSLMQGLTRHPRYGTPLRAGRLSADVENMRRHSAVFACRDLISRMISTLPIHEYRRESRSPNGSPGRLVPVDDPALWLENVDGRSRMFHDFAYAVIDSTLSRGMGFARVASTDRRGWPDALIDVDPTAVTVTERRTRSMNSTLGAEEWQLYGRPVELWPAGPLWVMHGYPVAGMPFSISPLTYASLAVEIGLNAQDFGAQFFRDGGIPKAVLENEAEVTPRAREKVLDIWEEETTGNRRVRALSNGWTFKQITINPDESQFLQTISATIPDIARMFGVDPRDIGSAVSGGGTLTYQNPELDQLRLLVRTLGPWLIRLEKALSALRPRGRVLRFNVDALLRVDTITRHKAYESAIRNGWLNVNEVRLLEDRPEIGEQGDRYLWPPLRQQLDTAETAADEETPDDVPEPNGSEVVGDDAAAE